MVKENKKNVTKVVKHSNPNKISYKRLQTMMTKYPHLFTRKAIEQRRQEIVKRLKKIKR